MSKGFAAVALEEAVTLGWGHAHDVLDILLGSDPMSMNNY
jgi:hypothetical protein